MVRKKRVLSWASDLDACEIGDYHLIPLTTSQALREEGREMHHCVGTYAQLCHQGLVQIFSVRDTLNRRIATLSLIWRDDYWHLEQIKGVGNAEVAEDAEPFFNGETTITLLEQTELHFIAQELLERYRNAWNRNLCQKICAYRDGSGWHPSEKSVTG